MKPFDDLPSSDRKGACMGRSRSPREITGLQERLMMLPAELTNKSNL